MSKPSELSRIPRLIGVEEAVRLPLESCRFRLEVEEVGVEESVGRVLAEDVVADRDRPACNEAFYDGYAIRSLDTVGASKDRPVRLRIVGSVDPTGRPGEVRLGEGEAAFTPCGAPLPEGADSVVRLEEALVEGGYLIVRREVKPSENVVEKGSDFRAGELLLPRGRMVRPQDLGLLMELGRSSVRVYRRVRVGVVPVGTDLVERARRGVSYPTATLGPSAPS